MKTLNSSRPKPGKAEIFSFVLLVLLFAAVFVVWHYGKDSGDQQKHSLVITPGESKITQNSEMNPDPDIIPVPEIPDADESVTKPEVKKVTPSIIAPPLPAHGIRLTESVVNASTGELIATKYNSQINIPPRAFLDAHGKVVEGNVKVTYREYHDFRDIFLSGIPMEFEKGMLESAGMIEINAAQNGEPVYVNPENKIRVMLASANKETNFNLYYLDQKEMKWKVKGKDEVVLTGQRNMPKTESLLLDSTEIKFRFYPAPCRAGLICYSDMNDKRKHWLSGKKSSPVIFDFRLSRTERMPAELKKLLGVTWRYHGEDAQDVYMNLFRLGEMPKQTLRSEIFINNVYVTEDKDKGPGNYRVNFEMDDEDRIINIPVVPVFSSERLAKNFTARWKKYSEAYEQAKYNEQKRFEKFKADSTVYFANNERYYKKYVTGETVALRTFEVSNFGIWNCDRPIPNMPNTVTAEFRDEKGNLLPITTGYLVMKSRNTVFTVTDFGAFRFDPNAQTLFWAVLPDNKLAIIYPKEFAKHQKASGSCSFTMQVNTSALDNMSSLKSALSFN